jgi:hypothetical protein
MWLRVPTRGGVSMTPCCVHHTAWERRVPGRWPPAAQGLIRKVTFVAQLWWEASLPEHLA